MDISTRGFEHYAVLVKTAPFLGVTGKLEARDNVVHLIADELWTPRLTVQPQHGRSGTSTSVRRSVQREVFARDRPVSVTRSGAESGFSGGCPFAADVR